MDSNTKDDLIVVPGFTNNSITMREVLVYLSRYYRVHCIDLPGFLYKKRPLRRPDIVHIAGYVNRRIGRLGLKSYYIAGLSLGYAIAARLPFDEQCRGILAILPYINAKFLKFHLFWRRFLKTGVSLINYFRGSNLVWNAPLYYHFLKRNGLTDEQIAMIKKHMDAATYFTVAEHILGSEEPVEIPRVPHAVILSKADELVDYTRSKRVFSRVSGSLILTTTIPHVPKRITQEVLAESFPPAMIVQIKNYFRSKRPLAA